jgi:hypothetical protein
MSIEERTGRLTLLIDPRKKAVFEYLCAREDVTPSQVVRRLIREYIDDKLGHPWKPGDTVEELVGETPAQATPKHRALKRRVAQ